MTADRAVSAAAFLRGGFAERIALVREAAGRRVWSTEMVTVWASLIERTKAQLSPTMRETLLRETIALDPASPEANLAYQALMTEGDAREPPPQLVSLVISHRANLERGRRLAASLSMHLRPLHIVVGDRDERRAQLDGNLLVVPAEDDYEGLPHKVLEAFVAVRKTYGRVPILKIDDDGSLTAQPDEARIRGLIHRAQYAGRAGGAERMDRCWHVGRCVRIPETPYGRPFLRRWALGPLYFVGAEALESIVRGYLSHPGLTEGEIFEDKLVGDLLAARGFELVEEDLPSIFGITPHLEANPTITPIAISD